MLTSLIKIIRKWELNALDAQLEKLTEHKVFHFFSEISSIPRGSGNEQAISNYLVEFAQERNLEVIQDKALNVIIKKGASIGYEDTPTVIIQGHMDMVCEKNEDTIHDFEKDPIRFRVVGDMLYATDTTLGADNGIAIAYALALLDANDLPHPALEVVLTTEEETTMNGANAVDPAHFTGKILINLDSGEEGKLLVSSAGGARITQIMPIDWTEASESDVAYCIKVLGLAGGHSGISIDQERGNSNKLLGRFLQRLAIDVPYSIQGINGGLKSNAIPREAEAIVFIQSTNSENVKKKTEEFSALVKKELQKSDPDVLIQIEKYKCTSRRIFSEATKQNAITSLMLIPHGVEAMSMDIEGLVESSRNLGVVTTSNEAIHFISETRSSVKSTMNYMAIQAKLLADLLQSELVIDSEYPEWSYYPESKVRKLFEATYKEKFGEEVEIVTVHAGIECGVFIEKIPGLDAISIGPNMFQIHTPEEHVSISSTINNWEYFIYTLERMKEYEGL
ncbi:aminoacyl-histidine dipeptidase [Sporosarcina sp. CAU 1771]